MEKGEKERGKNTQIEATQEILYWKQEASGLPWRNLIMSVNVLWNSCELVLGETRFISDQTE